MICNVRELIRKVFCTVINVFETNIFIFEFYFHIFMPETIKLISLLVLYFFFRGTLLRHPFHGFRLLSVNDNSGTVTRFKPQRKNERVGDVASFFENSFEGATIIGKVEGGGSNKRSARKSAPAPFATFITTVSVSHNHIFISDEFP